MEKRFLSLWFHHLSTDWFALKQPALRALPFVLSAPAQGRVIIISANALAEAQGIYAGLSVADARAMLPSLTVLDDRPALGGQLLQRIAEWCIRFTPFAAVDAPDGLLLEVTGCAHLWRGEDRYLADIIRRLDERGYGARGALADTIGTAWGQARFGQNSFIIPPGKQPEALSLLPAAALRLDPDMLDRLHKLGLRQIKDFISMPRSALRRRFGVLILQRLAQALGGEEETIQPIHPPDPYSERLPCPEPIVTLTGIEIALQRLLETLCARLREEGKGLRVAIFRGYRVDGQAQGLQIGTARASHNVVHLFYLFRIKLSTIEPALGIELFMLEAPHTEDHGPAQATMWDAMGGLGDSRLSELLDRL
ncbi:MAG: DNA polymerase Y family protein, partial [Chitinophagaceae bacterium]